MHLLQISRLDIHLHPEADLSQMLNKSAHILLHFSVIDIKLQSLQFCGQLTKPKP